MGVYKSNIFAFSVHFSHYPPASLLAILEDHLRDNNIEFSGGQATWKLNFELTE